MIPSNAILKRYDVLLFSEYFKLKIKLELIKRIDGL